MIAALAALALNLTPAPRAPAPGYTAQVDARLRATFSKLQPVRPHAAQRQGRTVHMGR